MRLGSLKFAGFRGARALASLDFAPGFVVIVGRNGTGKSTICDAIEFALTGDLRPESRHTEKGEGILDYIWWKGGGADAPEGRFVELTLVDDEGNEHRVRRTPAGAEVPPSLEHLLCHNPATLERPLSELCRTAILRDEEITKLSVDLKETDRFDAVRSALGTADFSTTEDRANEVVSLVQKERKRLEELYTVTVVRVADITARLSQAKTEVAKATEVAGAEEVLRGFVPDSPQAPAALADKAERLLSSLRVTTDGLTRLYARLQEYEKRHEVLQSLERLAELKSVSEQLYSAEQTAQSSDRDGALAAEEVAKAQLENPRNASLALLKEHGERVGLVNGECPLCGTKQDSQHYQEHLIDLARLIALSNDRLAALTKRAAEATGRAAAAKAEAARLGARLAALRRVETELNAEFESLRQEALSLQFELGLSAESALARIGAAVEVNRARASQIESSIAVVQASRAAEQVTALEQELKAAREETQAAERRFTRAGKAAHTASGALDAVRRTRGEYVNEQLAQLEPLLVELYQRLRPHIDWPDIHYRLRGDVRRMLRLEVGDGLNPSFVFSSGQRRAAGLAFLLALHLSRNWCALKTLILDDPVQHIDDYRALHLTEVLAAVRRTGRQVICTVEDESLGKLLARRLRSDAVSGGLLIRMAYSSRDGVHVDSVSRIPPMPRSVLVPA